MSLVLLSVVILGLGTAMALVVSNVTVGSQQSAALQLVEDRLDLVRTHPNYGTIESVFAGSETQLPGSPGFERTTTVVHTMADSADFKTVTVQVTGPGVDVPVARTATVAAP